MDSIQQAIITSLSTIIVALIGVATKALIEYLDKKGVSKQLEDRQAIVKIGVQAAEQLFKELDGKGRLLRAKQMIVKEMNKQGLHTTEEELNLFIEAAVEEMQRNRFQPLESHGVVFIDDDLDADKKDLSIED